MIRRVVLVLAGLLLAAGWYLTGRLHGSKERAYSSNSRTRTTTTTSNAIVRLVAANIIQPVTSAKNAPRKRAWNVHYLESLGTLAPGDPIRFELVGGEFATGRVHSIRRSSNEVAYVSGDLMQPGAGRFFFQKQGMSGVAGDFVGVITMAGKPMAYRIEPTGVRGTPELVERPVDDVICRGLPQPPAVPSSPTPDIPPLNPEQFPDLPIPSYQNGIVTLESLRGATPVIYLDFQGGYTPSWGGISYDRPNVSNAQIRDVWQRVAQDFLPFNINVTTDLGVFQRAPDNSRQRVIITPTTTVAAEAGGVAMIGSFNWTGDNPCWVFIVTGKYCAEACSHEAGHTLGLTHEGQQYAGQLFEYYDGHGIGDTSWAPIMGVPYYANVTQWSKGEYINPDNLQDQLAIISSQNNNVAYRPDDTGGTLATSRYLEVYPDYTAFAEGLIERSDDTDAFQFTTSGGDVWLRADPVSASPDLAIQVSLYDQNDLLIANNDPQKTLWADLTTNLPAGTYTFRVTGAGRNSPLTNGFSSYASLGYYSITGLVANARLPDRFSVPEHSTNGTFVGMINLPNTNDSFVLNIVSGNPGNTFAIEDSGALSVADNTLLDYDTLAARTQLAVQFELFVDLIDTVNPLLTETNRRVVVGVTYVPTPPQIKTPPRDMSVPAGSSPSLAPDTIGDAPLTYQWYFNDVPIPGTQNPVLSLTNVQAKDTGTYSLSITNYLGGVTGVVAWLSVTSSPAFITIQPQPQATAMGFPASFSVAAVGTEPLSYQWLLNGTSISFATTPTLVVPDVTPYETGNYQVVVSNALGISISSNATLFLEPVAAWGWNADGQTNLSLEMTNAVQIAAGPNYNLALKSDGTVFSWGATNEAGVPAGLTNVTAIAIGGAHGLALKNDGTLVTWGSSIPGQLPPPLSLSQVVAIAAGGGHSLALRSGGKVFGWGLNTNGQATVPAFLTNVIAIAAGSNHSLALGGDGRVWAWGNNSSGQCDIPTNLQSAVAIAAGAEHSLALQIDGTVVAWGGNSYGQSSVPSGLSGIIAVAAGAYHSLALGQFGTIYAWGAGATNAHRFPDLGQCLIPQPIKNGNNTAVAGGGAHTLAFNGATAPFITQAPVGCTAYTGRQIILRVAATGERPLSYQWQRNGTNLPGTIRPVLVLPFASATDAGDYQVIVTNSQGAATSSVATVTLKEAAPFIAAQPVSQAPYLGGQVRLFVAAYGTGPIFYQWRVNGADIPGATNSILLLTGLTSGQSGYYSVVVSNALGSISSAKAKVSVLQVVAWGAGTNYISPYGYGQSIVPLGLSDVTRVAGGSYHSLALEKIGRVIAWGAGTNTTTFQLGQNGYGQSVVPSYLTDITAIAGGMFHSLALRSDGYVFAWGINSGQTTVPNSLSDAIAIGAGRNHSVALRRDGRPVVWAASQSLQITNLPPAAFDLVSVAARGDQIVAVRGDGGVVRWGVPQQVPTGLSGVVEVAAGVNHALALKSDGTVVSLDNGYTPPTGLSNVVQIAAGNGFSMALRSDGSIAIWGTFASPYGVTAQAGLSNVTSIACGDYNALATLGDGSVSICAQPVCRSAAVGDRLFLRVGATGKSPLSYQWYFNNAAMLGATGSVLQLGSFQTTNAGDYFAVVSNPSVSITSSVASLSLTTLPRPTGIQLDQALGSIGLGWTTVSSNGWYGQSNITLGGLPTAQSGAITNNQQSWVQTIVTGPGSLNFWWKVSSEQYFDFLNFYEDGILLAGISGEVDWQSTNFFIPAGVHILEWSYQKDPSTSTGLDAGWLGQVSFLPDVPIILSQPLGQTSSMGARIVLSASVLGMPPMTFQWFKDGAPLPTATDSVFVIRNATRHSSGLYEFIVSNVTGSASSLFAPVVVRVPQKLTPLPLLPGGTFQLLSADADGGPLLPTDISGFSAQISTNLHDWQYVSNVLQLTNGALLMSQPLDPSNPPAFYRVLEHGQ